MKNGTKRQRENFKKKMWKPLKQKVCSTYVHWKQLPHAADIKPLTTAFQELSPIVQGDTMTVHVIYFRPAFKSQQNRANDNPPSPFIRKKPLTWDDS